MPPPEYNKREDKNLARLLVLLLVLIVYGSLYPFDFRPAHAPMLAWVWGPGTDGIRDAVLNLLLYLPVGFLVVATARPLAPVLTGSLVVMAISAAVECLQSFDRGRVSSLPDLLLNTLGGMAGAWTAAHLTSRIQPSLAVIVLALVARTFPFIPNLHPHLGSFRIDEAFFAAADWLAIRCALTVYLGRATVTRELALLLLVVPARVFLLDQTTSLADFAGAALALAIGHFWKPRNFAPVLLLALVGRELLPFHFTSTTQPFHWIPFETFLNGVPAGAVIFLGKLSFYAMILWLLDPEVRHMWRFAAFVAGLLVCLEALQCYLPGRTPDISDALIAVTAAAALAALTAEPGTPRVALSRTHP